MEAIQDAIRRLENIPTTIKKRKDVEAAITQLSSTARLLDLPSASPNTFARLAENLRGRLLPLYRVSLSLTLDYAIAVFRFIHYSKLIPILQVGHSLPNSWETLLMSLFSGILDILEENSNNKTRENIAYALYPVLCPLYFVPISGPPLSFHGELLSTVYQILTATVTSHPRNAATLREHHIQRINLGVTISQTKDFLAIESLLDLFGSIIPSLKGGRDKRTAFIRDVFDSVVFKDAGSAIHKLLEDISSPDWSVTAEKIVKILAENDLSFPQPFEASRLLLNESLTDSFSPFYIDNKKFVINIDKDGRIETLSIPYSTIKSIIVSRRTNDNVQIIVQLVKAPMLGNQPLFFSSEENLTISWEVKKSSLNDLVNALRCRDLNIGKSGSKLSKVKPIELDFQSNKQDLQILTKKRFEQLSQSWALPISPNNERKIVQLETSPLLPDTFRQTARTSNTAKVVSPAHNTSKRPLTSFSTMFVNPDENSSIIPQTKVISPKTLDQSSPAMPSPHDGDTMHKTLDEGDAKTLAPKTKKRRLILSDDEFEATSGDEFESISTVSKPITKTPPEQNTLSSATTPIEPLTIKGAGMAKTARFQKPEPGISEQGDLKKSKKRPSPDVEPNVIDVDGEETSTKAPKRGHHEAMSPTSARPHKRVKYSRKERTSPPTVLSPSGIDFEEIPKPALLKKLGLESSTKPRASAMKGKYGKPVPKPKASAKKQVMKVRHVDLDSKAAIITHSENDLTDEVAIATLAEKEGNDHGGTTVRRSARTSNLRSHTEGTQTRNVIESSTPKKPRKAPWEDPDFLKQAQGLSDQIIPPSSPIHSSPIAELKDAEVTEQSSDIDVFVDNAQSDKLGAKDRHEFHATPKVASVVKPIKEYKKLEPIVSKHPVQEAIVIDLTTNTSPIVLKKANTFKPPDVCICRTHQVASHPVTEGMPKKEERLEEAKISMTASIAPLKKNKTGGQAFFQKIKTEEHSSPKGLSPRPMFKILKMENASPPVPRTTSDSKSGIQKNLSTPLAVRHKKERSAVNSSLSPFKSLPLSNKIQIPPIKAFEVVDRERQQRESIGYSNTRHVQNSQMRNQVLHSKIKPDPMQRILEVVQKINEVIVHNIENRFEKITDSLNTGQRAILEGTANSLQNMYHESARHFNEMVDLEEDYTSHRTIITSHTHDYVKSSEQLVQCFKDVAVEHSRQTLSKRLPATLFVELPAIILKPAIKF